MKNKSHEKLTVLIPAPRLSTGFAPIWLAEALGYAADENIDVIFNLARSGSGLMAAEGVPLRHLPSPMIDRLTPSSSMCALDESLSAQPGLFGAFGHAVAKATVFALANPAAAIRAVWRRFRGAGPQRGQNDERAFRGELAALKERLEGKRIDYAEVPKCGAITEREIAAWQEFLLATKAISTRRPPSDYFSDALVTEFNAFDPQPIIAQAKAFSV